MEFKENRHHNSIHIFKFPHFKWYLDRPWRDKKNGTYFFKSQDQGMFFRDSKWYLELTLIFFIFSSKSEDYLTAAKALCEKCYSDMVDPNLISICDGFIGTLARTESVTSEESKNSYIHDEL